MIVFSVVLAYVCNLLQFLPFYTMLFFRLDYMQYSIAKYYK